MFVMDLYREALEMLRLFALAAGSLVISIGILSGVLTVRRIGEGVSLGLEFFVAATVLNLILNPSWTAVATTAVTVVARKLATFSLGLRGLSSSPP